MTGMYRGISKITGEWIYGWKVANEKEAWIVNHDGESAEAVWPQTVGQETGRMDYSETPIFCGDVVQVKNCMILFTVIYSEKSARFELYGDAISIPFPELDCEILVTGSIHDHMRGTDE